ncbi:MAG TPA: alpha/beta hydrolase, partial [Burkholderiaceae bacterium]|nr:alpha/beta hydrolase [Burkholderiaceae bacterium]
MTRIPCISTLAGLLLAGLAACSPIRALDAVSTGGDAYAVSADVPYGANARQKLDVYTPTSAAPAGGWPLVVFFYGGSWSRGEKHDYGFVGAALARRGVLVVVADYRLYPEVRYP